MGYKRAEWHSGYTYKQTCRTCHAPVEYTDYELGFRPWFADGFVYCPQCKTPLRHNEKYAIDNPNMTAAPERENVADFCTGCGYAFNEGDLFCAKCGKKR